jgi:hypothetical protein
MPIKTGSTEANESVDLGRSARIALVVVASVVALLCEAMLLARVWSDWGARANVPISLYALSVLNLFPWLTAMQWLWKIRRDARTGLLDAARAKRCYNIVGDLLTAAYIPIAVLVGRLLVPF